MDTPLKKTPRFEIPIVDESTVRTFMPIGTCTCGKCAVGERIQSLCYDTNTKILVRSTNCVPAPDVKKCNLCGISCGLMLMETGTNQLTYYCETHMVQRVGHG